MTQLVPEPRPGKGLLPDHVLCEGARGRLLTAAVELFATRGYHGVSVRDITTRMGVQPSSLYAQYRSKAELFGELAFVANDEIRLRLDEALAGSGHGAPEQLQAVVSAYIAFHTEYPLLGTLGHNDLNELTPESLRRVSEVRHESVQLLRGIIARGHDAGDFDCPRPWLAVAAIASMGIRVAAWYRPTHPQPDATEAYPTQVQHWMSDEISSTDLADVFVGFALNLVNYRPSRAPDRDG